MSEPRKPIFPVAETPITSPTWLKGGGEGAAPVQSLIDRLETGAEDPPARAAPAAAGAPRPAPKEPARKPPPPREPRKDPAIKAREQREERDRPPPPPRMPKMSSLGALVPGGRSVMPPAFDSADFRHEGGMNAFAEAVTELAIARASVLASVESDLLDLSLQIASAIVETEVEHNPELHSTLVRAALRTLGDFSRVRIRTSREAFGALVEHMGSANFEMNGIAVELIADASIPGLGCIIDEEQVRVDATVAERLRSVRIAFEDERRRRPGDLE
jgi:hypothetical protein